MEMRIDNNAYAKVCEERDELKKQIQAERAEVEKLKDVCTLQRLVNARLEEKMEAVIEELELARRVLKSYSEIQGSLNYDAFMCLQEIEKTKGD
jgi:hypothetical protein